jgi:hypothetical protein
MSDSPHSAVDHQELDRHIAEMYREVASDGRRDLHFPTGRPLAEALGYPARLLDMVPADAVRRSKENALFAGRFWFVRTEVLLRACRRSGVLPAAAR